jgi:ABC-type nickel/cobalt efflux system permease component RcnA/stage V sporulation protein SpoVS
MTARLQRPLVAALAALAFLASAGLASAHPLGNYTVNRAVGVRVAASGITVRHVIDMAEIPAFSELQLIDGDDDGQTSAAELADYASAACASVRSNLELEVDASALTLRPRGAPQLSFPAGAGGLPTLRLVCDYQVAVAATAGQQTVSVADKTDDGHLGWHEVTITAGPGVELETSDVPQVSPSAELTAYPVDALQTPPDVRFGTARFHRTSNGSVGPTDGGPLAPVQRATADDPLAALVGGELTPAAALGALLLAVLLGAGHAVSPGHGKTLIAAYLIGSRGSVRHAATLGVTVAVTHTAGVFLLGAVTLLIGQFFVPERVIEWLSIASGVLVAILGAGLVFRAIRGASHATHDHPHPHPHPRSHSHGHAHPHPETQAPELRRLNVITLGLAGGMVPSASALIVFLVAITTGRLLFGLLLIAAFGAGMAVVLGGLAVVTTALRGTMRASTRVTAHPWAKLAARSLPLVSGIAVLVAGLSVSIGALARFA